MLTVLPLLLEATDAECAGESEEEIHFFFMVGNMDRLAYALEARIFLQDILTTDRVSQALSIKYTVPCFVCRTQKQYFSSKNAARSPGIKNISYYNIE
jgi:hypothetical protein